MIQYTIFGNVEELEKHVNELEKHVNELENNTLRALHKDTADCTVSLIVEDRAESWHVNFKRFWDDNLELFKANVYDTDESAEIIISFFIDISDSHSFPISKEVFFTLNKYLEKYAE